ncbi:MAG: ribonuclease R [Bdellovibrionales bacterium]|nr:ribonuclease R [Bdellovibrionales bacterium]
MEQAIVKLVHSPDYKPVKPRVIAEKLDVPVEHLRDVKKLIKKMVKRGQLAYGSNHLVAAPGAAPKDNRITGVFRRTQHGYGFVRPSGAAPGDDRRQDVYISANRAHDAASGDTVLVRLTPKRDHARPNPEGEILEIIERQTHQFVGVYFEDAGFAYVQVDGTLFTQPVLVGDPGAKNAQPGDKVVFEMVRFPSHIQDGEGVITDVLGPRGAPGVDTLSIVREFGLPEEFPDDVLISAREQAERFDESLGDRLDLTKEAIITIDPVDARDFDDAISLERLDNGHWWLGVHIADVSHFVPPGSPLDHEAHERGTSTYLPDRVLPMLPERLSNGICSLNPNVDRLVLVAEMDFDQKGVKRGHKVYEAVFQSHHRCVYEPLQEFYDNPSAPHPYSEKVVPSLLALHELYKLVKAQRSSRGSVELELPEAKVIVNRETGEVDNIKVIERVDTHKLIEEFMIAANEAVSEIMIEARRPFLFRVHEVPEEEAVMKFVEVASTMGALIDRRWLENLEPHSYQKLVEAIRPSPSVRVLNFLLLRSMKQAVYSHENLQHFGLASRAYTHFTSPIRRYPDLIVHRLLKAWLRRDDAAARSAPGSLAKDLEEAAHHCSQRERAAVDAERELLKMKQVRHAEKHLGEEHEGVITGVAAKGLFVELQRIFIEGFVPVDRLGNGMQFNERALILKERGSNRLFRIGDRIKVQIARTNIHLLQIELEPLSHPEPQRAPHAQKQKSQKRGRRR